MKQILVIFFLLATITAQSQTKSLAVIEKELIKASEKVFSFYRGDTDSLLKYSSAFDNKLEALVRGNSSTLNYPFKLLIQSRSCNVVTSSDQLLRVYSWDTWLGGTMHQNRSIYQFKSPTKVGAANSYSNGEEMQGYCQDIFTVNAGVKKYYLVVDNYTLSTKDAMESVRCFTITNGKLNDNVKLFKTKTKLLNQIDVEFDFFSVYKRPERPLRLIKYDDKKQILYIPIVVDKGKVTNNYILYKFNGKYFEFVRA